MAVLSLSTFLLSTAFLSLACALASAFAFAAASLLMSFWSFVSNPEVPISSVDTPSFLTEASELDAEELSAGLAAEELFACALLSLPSAAGLAAEDDAALLAFADSCSFLLALFAEASFFCSAFAALLGASAFFCSVCAAALVADLSAAELAALVGAALLAAELAVAPFFTLAALSF